MTTPRVVNDTTAQRFTANVHGQLARLDYLHLGNRLVLTHTEVPQALEGQGVGGALVEAAVDDATRRGLTIVAECPFARRWLEQHRAA